MAVRWHADAQHTWIVWPPIPASLGTAMVCLTFPYESARKGNTWMSLCSRISPLWFAGRLLAVSSSESPAATVDGLSDTTGWGRPERYPAIPMMSNTMRAKAMRIAFRPRWEVALGTGGGDG